MYLDHLTTKVGPMEVLTPNGKIRKITKIYATSSTYSTRAIGYEPCAITVTGQLIRGWKDTKTGRFVPDANNNGLLFLSSRQAIEPEWEAAAETVFTIDRKALAMQSLKHGTDDCQPPPRPDWQSVSNYEKALENWQTRTLGNGAIVHGVVMPEIGFYPSTDCPNFSLWEKE